MHMQRIGATRTASAKEGPNVTSWFKLGSILLLVASGAIAQVSPQQQVLQQQSQQQQNGNIPTGSPLGSSNTGNQSAIPNQVGPLSTPLGPTAVVDTERSFRTSERLLDLQQGNAANGTLRLPAQLTPNEYELFVERVVGRKLPRFGSELLLPSQRDFATPATATIPPDYIVNVGDVIAISMTGSVEGSVEREVDTNGRIFLPRVGSIQVGGIRYGDLRDRVSAAIGRQFRGYDVTVEIRRLRGIRVYVTGFASNPGAFTVSSLSTLANAVFQAGGPNSGGSFRSVKLYRNGREVTDFDLYSLIRAGDRSGDVVLQNEDVLFIPPAGPQVALIGSVTQEAIYEAKPGESLETLLYIAGGTNSLADPTRLILYRNNGTDAGPRQVLRTATAQTAVEAGDIIQVLSRGSLVQPIGRQSVLVRIDGEVVRPGNYYVQPNTPMAQIVALAGGLTPQAYVYGTKLQRVSVRAQQRESYREAIRQLELTLASAPLTADQTTSAADRAAQLAGARETLDRLREAEPDGRVVLDVRPDSVALPGSTLLENNDQIFVPPFATTVGVFGAVYRPASFLLTPGQRPMRVRDYLYRAGGPLRAADLGSIFVVRASGEVLSRKRGAMNAYVLPGDVVFVPVKTSSSSFWVKLREISTILFQVGLSAATIGNLSK